MRDGYDGLSWLFIIRFLFVQNISKYSRTYQNLSISKKSKYIRIYQKILNNIRICPNIPEYLRIYLYMS